MAKIKNETNEVMALEGGIDLAPGEETEVPDESVFVTEKPQKSSEASKKRGRPKKSA